MKGLHTSVCSGTPDLDSTVIRRRAPSSSNSKYSDNDNKV